MFLPRRGLSKAQVDAEIAAAGGLDTTAVNALIATALAAGDYQTLAEATALIAASLANPFDAIHTISHWIANPGVPGQNQTYLMVGICGRLLKAQSITKVRVYNGATVNGNFAISAWSSDGTTITRLGGTGSVAQVGTYAFQSVNLSVTFPTLQVPFLSFSSDSATGEYLNDTSWVTGKTGGGHLEAGIVGGFNVTAAQTIASVAGVGLAIWVEAS